MKLREKWAREALHKIAGVKSPDITIEPVRPELRMFYAGLEKAAEICEGKERIILQAIVPEILGNEEVEE